MSLVWRWASPYIQNSNIQVDEIEGLIWQGNALITIDRQPIKVQWDFKPGKLITGKAVVDIRLDHSLAKIESQAWVSFGQSYGINALEGYIDDQLANKYLLPPKTTINGRLWIDSLSLTGDSDVLLTAANGSARWTGGEMNVPVGRNQFTAEIPPLELKLNNADAKINISIKDAENREWVNGTLEQTGWFSMLVMQTAADQLNLPVQGSSKNIIFEMKQKIY